MTRFSTEGAEAAGGAVKRFVLIGALAIVLAVFLIVLPSLPL
ncbi:MAG: hypothetical protein V3S51_09320 [Dehalococcoidia bacterium]